MVGEKKVFVELLENHNLTQTVKFSMYQKSLCAKTSFLNINSAMTTVKTVNFLVSHSSIVLFYKKLSLNTETFCYKAMFIVLVVIKF